MIRQLLVPSKLKRANLPLPLLPTNRRSLNFATEFLMYATEFLSSAQKFSSLPADIVTFVPSFTSPRATTLKATGRVLLERQCEGKTEQTKLGEPVRTSSPGCSLSTVLRVRSPVRMSDMLCGESGNGVVPFKSGVKCMWLESEDQKSCENLCGYTSNKQRWLAVCV